MRKSYLILFIAITLAASCQKAISDFDPATTTTQPPSNGSGSFEATINGEKKSFTVKAATLVRNLAANEKRMDITGISTDNKTTLILTLGEEISQGNTVTVKKYVLNAFPDDDPATPGIDESLYTQGFTTYGIAIGSNWLYDVFEENGSCTVSNCDAAATRISGEFETTLTDLIDATHIVRITAGKFTNIKYTVQN
ncbi:MAG: hypothetical protein ABI813_04305 [Bacteroidota bacterium]